MAACWVLLLAMTSSMAGATVLLLILAALSAGCAGGLRAMGINGSHPWIRRMRSRPWREGQEVLQLALRHLPEVFVITPSGSLLAPNSIELWLHPRDLASLCELMDIGLVSDSAAEVYREQAAARGARFARAGGAEVRVVADPSVPAGRYRWRQARPLATAPAAQPETAPAAQPAPRYRLGAGNWPYAHDGRTRGEPVAAATAVTGQPAIARPGQPRAAERGQPTVAEGGQPAIPALRLITGDSVSETRVPEACAGRGEVELVLPEVPTISREHARFTYSGGQWWVTNLGRNGLVLNGTPLTGQRAVSDGDLIRWGSKPSSPVSLVEIG